MGKPILYDMLNRNLFRDLIFGERAPVPNVAVGQFDELPEAGATIGTLILGRPGTGKTTMLAQHLIDYAQKYQDRAIISLDWSGSISDTFLWLAQAKGEAMIKRIVYDPLGHPEWVVPMPEFSPLYGDYEAQVQRVSRNLMKLSPELVERATVIGGLALEETAPELFKLLTAIENEHGEPWQITESKKLLLDPAILRLACKQFGYKVPSAKFYFERELLSRDVKGSERDLRTFALRAVLGAIEPKNVRARLGYYKPGWTPKEAIDKGLIVLVDGSYLINEPRSQHYLFTQVYSLIMAEINKRIPGNPNDKPVVLVMDEVYSLLGIKGMAEEVGKLSPLYRSRKLQPYIVLQSLSQLDETLRKQIWTLGNIVCFAISNFEEAYEISQQLFKYQATVSRLPARTQTQQPILESDRGQYLTIANWLQRLNHRECVIRRYFSEQQLDKYIRLVPKTKDTPPTHPLISVPELKDRLLKERGIPIREALEVINQRKLTVAENNDNRKPPTIT